VTRQHRIGRPVEFYVPLYNGLSQPVVSTFLTQILELGVQVEYHRRMRKAPCNPARARVQTYDVEALATDAHRELFGRRVGADRVVPRKPFPVNLVDALKAREQVALKISLIKIRRAGKMDNEAMEHVLRLATRGKTLNCPRNGGIVFRAPDVGGLYMRYLIAGMGRPGGKAGKRFTRQMCGEYG
jgi:hypothetical protein